MHRQVRAIANEDTFFYYGDRNGHILFEIFCTGEVMEDKVLLVKSGGTLEIHGERRLPWTKLAQTAPRLQEVPDILEGKVNQSKYVETFIRRKCVKPTC